jgi:hypothetical protein
VDYKIAVFYRLPNWAKQELIPFELLYFYKIKPLPDMLQHTAGILCK